MLKQWLNNWGYYLNIKLNKYISYCGYKTVEVRDIFKKYDPFNKYNVTAPAKFLVNLFKNKTIMLTLTPNY